MIKLNNTQEPQRVYIPRNDVYEIIPRNTEE